MLYNIFFSKKNIFFIKSGFLIDYFFKVFAKTLYYNIFIASFLFFFEKYLVEFFWKNLLNFFFEKNLNVVLYNNLSTIYKSVINLYLFFLFVLYI